MYFQTAIEIFNVKSRTHNYINITIVILLLKPFIVQMHLDQFLAALKSEQIGKQKQWEGSRVALPAL